MISKSRKNFEPSIRDHRWNYLQRWTPAPDDAPPLRELYNLEDDPKELENVIADAPEAADEMASSLEEYIRRMRPLTSGTFQGVGVGQDLSFDALPRVKE